MKKVFCAAVVLLSLVCGTSAMAQAGKTGGVKPAIVAPQKLTEEQKINHLINYVRSLEGATFIRNGSEYSAKAAAEHLQMKREKAGSKVKTARDFIEGLASESYLSGRKYQIRMKDGKVYYSGEVLLRELERIENK